MKAGSYQLLGTSGDLDGQVLEVWVAPMGATTPPELERQLEQARQLAANLEAIADAWARRAELQERLLVHYRLGTNAHDELLEQLHASRRELEALGQEVGA